MNIPINYDQPMNGLIKRLKLLNKLNIITTSQTSFASNDYNSDASVLLDQSETSSKCFKFGENRIGEYFEIHLKNYVLNLAGYGFKATKANSNIPWNWNVLCSTINPPVILSSESNNQELCPGVSGSNFCPNEKEKAFSVDRKMKCSDFRFTTTGRTSWGSDKYFFALKGIELFGTLSFCAKNTHEIKSNMLMNFVLIYQLILS